jgi:hypothetical protein
MNRLSALVLLAASFLGTVTSASAQIARDGSYYEETRAGNCASNVGCILEFSPVPQLILFSKINCLANNTGNGFIYALAFEIRDVSGGASRRREFLPIPTPVFLGGPSSTNVYSFMSPTDFMVSASKFPVIEGSVIGGGTIECKITGRLQ